MKNITINVTLRTFEELSIKSQKKAIADYLDSDNSMGIIVETDNLFEDYLEVKGYSMKEKYFGNGRIHGFISNEDLKNVVARLESKEGLLLDEMKELAGCLDFTMVVDSHYGTVDTTNAGYCADMVSQMTDMKYETLRCAEYQLEKIVKMDLIEAADKYERIWLEVEEDFSSDDYAIEMIASAGHERFLEDGTMFELY